MNILFGKGHQKEVGSNPSQFVLQNKCTVRRGLYDEQRSGRNCNGEWQSDSGEIRRESKWREAERDELWMEIMSKGVFFSLSSFVFSNSSSGVNS